MQNELILFLVFIFASAGATIIVNASTLFQPLRKWVEVKYKANEKNTFYWWLKAIASCAICFGIYSGLTCYLLIYQKLDLLIIPFAFMASLASYFISVYIEKVKRY